ncbi:MAG: phospho-sugar mutase [Pirellulales bacterium]
MNVAQAIAAATQAAADQRITSSALVNLKSWLEQDRYAEYRDLVIEHIEAGNWQKLDDVYWTIIPFGTGGRRGRMYPIGSNAINDRTIGESAQGLATYVLEQQKPGESLSCAIAYDTRHRSRHFAELCASIMVANGFKVYFLDDYRATPQLSYAVRKKGCNCGIMVTASHNPPSDNAVKVYWSTGGQVLPPHDKAIIDRVMNVQEIKRTEFASAVSAGKVEFVTAEIDEAYVNEAVKFAWPGPRDLRLIYSPLHGVGSFAVMPLLAKAGFQDVTVYERHATPSGDFPNVPGNVSNPENAKVFDEIIAWAKANGGELILATDPDCDRMGCAAPLTPDIGGPWGTLTGNQLGVLLTDFVCLQLKAQGKLTSQSYVIKTLVTTEMTRRVAEHYGARCEGNLHVGFKWIAGVMDDVGPEGFVFGTEESHGYLIGTYARDKDGAVACLLMAEMAAYWKQQGKSLHQRLNELFALLGCHEESLVNVQMEGSEGMALMQKLMTAFRSAPPQQLGGIAVAAVRDYKALTRTPVGGHTEKLDAPPADMVMLDLAEEGNYFAVRPSGTEPKVKFYTFAYEPAGGDTEQSKAKLRDRLSALEQDIRKYVASVVGAERSSTDRTSGAWFCRKSCALGPTGCCILLRCFIPSVVGGQLPREASRYGFAFATSARISGSAHAHAAFGLVSRRGMDARCPCRVDHTDPLRRLDSTCGSDLCIRTHECDRPVSGRINDRCPRCRP